MTSPHAPPQHSVRSDSLHNIGRFLTGTVPNVKNFDKFLGTFDSIEDPEWAAGDLANVSGDPSPINWPNLGETR
jgi:hypothetical protein